MLDIKAAFPARHRAIKLLPITHRLRALAKRGYLTAQEAKDLNATPNNMRVLHAYLNRQGKALRRVENGWEVVAWE